MRYTSLVALGMLAVVGACEGSTSPKLATVGGQISLANSSALTISPAQITIPVGSTSQLSTNASPNQQAQLQWSSSNTAVATVSATGVVTGLNPGTATINVRFSFDTTHAASATVNVTP